MTSDFDLLVIHPWADPKWRLQLGWLAALAEAVAGPRTRALNGSPRFARRRVETLALPSAVGFERGSVSHMVKAGRTLAQTMSETLYRHCGSTHLLCLEANVDTLVALGELLARFPVRDGVFVFDLTPDGWLAATSPFGLEALTHLVEVLDRGGANIRLFAVRNAAQEELGRSVGAPLMRLADLPASVPFQRPCSPQPASPKEPIAVAVRSLARELGLYTAGLADPVRLAVVIEAVARRFDFPLEWRRELAAAGDRWSAAVDLDAAPTPPLQAVPDLVACLSSMGRHS